jgi:3-hydroxyacyl-CoA dehydrogenase
VVGLHFFSPANVMKLLEVVRGKETSKEVLATVMQLAKKIKKTAVVSGVCDGFIGNRMLELYMRQTEYLLQEGATPGRWTGAGEVGHGDGPVPHERPGGRRHRLGHPQASLQGAAELKYARCPTCCARWDASARRPARAGTSTSPARDAIPTRWWRS